MYRHGAILPTSACTNPTIEEPKEVVGLSQYDVVTTIGSATVNNGLANGEPGAGLGDGHNLDILSSRSAEPCEFLDMLVAVRTKEKVTEAFKIILRPAGQRYPGDSFFGGIMRCDVIAERRVAA